LMLKNGVSALLPSAPVQVSRQMHEVTRGRFDRGKSLAVVVRFAPAGSWRGDARQDRNHDLADDTWRLGYKPLPVRARDTCDHLVDPHPTWRSRSGGQLIFGGEVKKRRKCGKRADFPGATNCGTGATDIGEFRIRNFLGIDVRHNRVCRAQIDSDQIREGPKPHLLSFREFQLELPALRVIAEHAPDLEVRFGDASLDAARTTVPLLAIQLRPVTSSGLSSSISVPQIFQQAADQVLFTNAGT